jgi:hypothetical protein
MPFTYLAHQAPVLAIKRRWPAFYDGTALAIGSMAPDWAYALSGSRWAFDGHSVQGVIGFCIPATVIATLVLRHVAPMLFAYLPSPRHLPLRQLRMLGARRPAWLFTLTSAALGAFSHVAWDLFTHNDRWGPRHIAWLRSTALSVAGHHLTWAKVLQYTSHVLGSIVALVLLAQILRSGAKDDACEWTATTSGRGLLLAMTAVGTVAGGVWAMGDPGLPAMIIRLSLGVFAGVVSGCVMLRWRWGSSYGPPG